MHTILTEVSSEFCQKGALVSFDGFELQDRGRGTGKNPDDKMRVDDSVEGPEKTEDLNRGLKEESEKIFKARQRLRHWTCRRCWSRESLKRHGKREEKETRGWKVQKKQLVFYMIWDGRSGLQINNNDGNVCGDLTFQQLNMRKVRPFKVSWNANEKETKIVKVRMNVGQFKSAFLIQRKGKWSK